MSELEVVATSSQGNLTSCVNVWSIHTGTILGNYRVEGVHGIDSIASYGGSIVASTKSKPLLFSLPLNKLKHDSFRFLCPGKVACIDCSPDGSYLVVAVHHNVHLYQICSGKMLSIGASHFQPIVVVRFNNDGSLIACGGEDGQISIWLLSSMILKKNSPEPLHLFSSHSLPVNDLKFTSGGLKSRIISVSGDRTCKVNDLGTGSLLLTLLFDVQLTSLALLQTERMIFIGNGDGGIHRVLIHNPPRQQQHYYSKCDKYPSFFKGHSKAITCLSCSMNCTLLITGSQDETVKVWHILSGQCLKTIHHKGIVTNLLVFVPSNKMFSQQLRGFVKLCKLSLSLDSEDDFVVEIDVNINLEEQCFNRSLNLNKKANQETAQLHKVNNKLFKFALNKIIGKKLKYNKINRGVSSNLGKNVLNFKKYM